MAVTETVTISWGSRLGSSIKGIVVGFALFVVVKTAFGVVCLAVNCYCCLFHKLRPFFLKLLRVFFLPNSKLKQLTYIDNQ